MRKNSTVLSKIHTVSLSVSLSPKRPWLFTKVDCALGETKQSKNFQGLLDTGSELTLIPQDPKRHCDPPVRIGAYGGQVIQGVLAQACLTVGPMGPFTHLVVISPVSKCIIGIDILSTTSRISTLLPECSQFRTS